MRKIILFNPSVSSLNCGDHIIFNSISANIKKLFPQAFYVEVSTHLPLSNSYIKRFGNTDYKFVCGTNLLKSDMLFGFRQWDISPCNIKYLKPVVLAGCGWWQYQNNIDLYSKYLLNQLLNNDFLHSVRDNYTLEKLNSIGIKNVINTGCPTIWDLDSEHCFQIKKQKSYNVVTTLTDYAPNPQKDTRLFDILSKNYEKVYLWIQGYDDYEYFESLNIKSPVTIIPPILNEYDKILNQDNIEYVGTRLHGGIRALQLKKRTIFIAVDNRAIEKKKDFNINVIERDNIEDLQNYLLSDFETKININVDKINRYLQQF